MPLALANVLKASLVIFSCVSEQPLYILPREVSIQSAVFLVHQPGHYDAAIPYLNPPSTSTPTQQPIQCSCGVNKKSTDKYESCSMASMYKSRCKCLQSKHPCTSLCRCKHCNNIYGKRDPASILPRKRTGHQLQIQLPSSKKFAESRQEDIIAGCWSAFETMAIKEICKTYTDLDDIYTLYNSMVQYTHSPLCSKKLPHNAVFGLKTTAQIAAKLAYLSKTHTL